MRTTDGGSGVIWKITSAMKMTNGIAIARASDPSPDFDPESASAAIFTIQKIPSPNSTASNGRYAHGCTLPKASGLAAIRLSSAPTTKLSIVRNFILRLHLSGPEERSARFLSRRERFNASMPATLITALRQYGSAGVNPLLTRSLDKDRGLRQRRAFTQPALRILCRDRCQKDR